MANIDDFKANLIGGGARANQFRVTITPPPGIAIGLDVRRTSFLIQSAQLPGMTLGEVAVPFRGRVIYVAGDRPEFETWTVSVLNDTDFMVRNAMERWNNGINYLANNTGVNNPADYQTDLFVEQLDRDDVVLKSYIFRSAYPSSVGTIDLNVTTNDTIETFDIVWRYQHFEASGVNF